MPHQKDCYRLRVVSYSSDPSGDHVSPIAIVRKLDRVAGHATRQRRSMVAKTGTTMTEHVQS